MGVLQKMPWDGGWCSERQGCGVFVLRSLADRIGSASMGESLYNLSSLVFSCIAAGNCSLFLSDVRRNGLGAGRMDASQMRGITQQRKKEMHGGNKLSRPHKRKCEDPACRA